MVRKVLTSTALIPIRKLAQKGVIAKGLVNEFDGDVEVLDDLNDHWCSKHHKAERNRLIKRLQNLVLPMELESRYYLVMFIWVVLED